MIFATLPTGQNLQTLLEEIKSGRICSQYRMVPSSLYLPVCTNELSALLIGIKGDGSIIHGIRYYTSSKTFVKVSEDDYINIHGIIGWRYGNVILENNGYLRLKDNKQVSHYQVFNQNVNSGVNHDKQQSVKKRELYRGLWQILYQTIILRIVIVFLAAIAILMLLAKIINL